jgi:CubicO group peptidase (beta-lactamase class C family)
MRGAIGCLRLAGLVLVAVCLIPRAARAEWADEGQTVRAIVNTFANAAIHQGVAVGVAVGVVDKTGVGFQKAYSFGYADAATQTPFATNSIFEIGSTTKVFTTNLLGQSVFENTLSLDDQLSRFGAELGQFTHPLTGEVTLVNLGDFTGGFPTYAPICKSGESPATTGCRPSARPSISDYGAADFLAFFQNYKEKVGSLPAPYEYSDYSTGLLGLLLGTRRGQPITDDAVDGWYNEVNRRILRPLHMQSTFLDVPATDAERTAKGYDLAIAAAEVTGGAISQIDVLGGGRSYSATPLVTITGGGGSGASATATLKNDTVDKINVTTGGSGYTAPPTIVFNNGGSTKMAHALPIVSRGAVKAVLILLGGAGYQRAPHVTINGGGGTGAAATAHIANGRVVAVTVTNGGSGYPDPLTAIVAPGGAESSGVPIWAAAGALKSTLDDLMSFAGAALTPGAKSRGLPPSLTAGFKIAEKAYACQNSDPDLSTCPAESNRSALAWGVTPADESNGVPEVVVKDGGLPGFSSEIFLMPKRQLAVVVMVNSRSPATGHTSPLAFRPAETLAADLAYNLFYALPVKGTQ